MARPTPPIHLSPEQEKLLQALAHSRETPHGLVIRAKIILAASQGRTNQSIAEELDLCEETVGMWRKRWRNGSAALTSLERCPPRLRQAIGVLLADQPRPGCPPTFTAEQVCQIMALACEKPPEALSHWTGPDLAQEAIRRGIVEQISDDRVRRFLKSGGPQAASPQILAEPHRRRPRRLSGGGQGSLPALSSSAGVA